VHFLTIVDIEVDLTGLLSPVVRSLVNISEILGYFGFYHLSILECLSFTKFILPLHLSYYRVAPSNLQERISLFVKLLHLTVP
jgi:hypothetical protein